MAVETRWLPPEQQDMPAELQSWLTGTGSLTHSLQTQADQGFSVKVLAEQWQKALSDEAGLLGIQLDELVYQREVTLLNGLAADVYARTVIPRATFDALSERFTQLGSHSLGEMLFTDPTVRRGEIEVVCLQAGHALYDMTKRAEPELSDTIWARRSLFYIGDKVLLVNEIFLPNLIDKHE